MQITELKVTIGEVCEGYINDAEEGVVGYDEHLDIRPKYQRAFVYKDNQRDDVIRTVMKGLPLNVIYWCKVKKEDGSDGFEVLDGQQRTISVCEYVDGTFSVDDKYFYNLPSDKQKQILDYPLFVYVCDGTDSEKLDWFRIINIAGEQLQEKKRSGLFVLLTAVMLLRRMKNKNIDAQFAAENLSLNRCMPIILLRGAKAEKQHRIIARCFAATAI